MKQRHKGTTLNVPENKTESFFAGMDEDLKLKLYSAYEDHEEAIKLIFGELLLYSP